MIQINHLRALFLLVLTLTLAGCTEPTVVEEATDTSAAQPANTPEFTAQKAETGVGKQGQSLQNETGVSKIIAQPAVTLFRVKQKVIFEIQLPQAMNLFNAYNGRLPESHEEYMRDIVEANNIILPELPAGQVYRYRPEVGELWVEPADGSGAAEGDETDGADGAAEESSASEG